MDFPAKFFAVYPEFMGRVPAVTVEAQKDRALVSYPVLRDMCDETHTLATCMVVAFYISRSGVMGEDFAAGGVAAGVITSASVGEVSIGFQQKPIKDMFEDFFAGNIYGQEFLAWLASRGGIKYVN